MCRMMAVITKNHIKRQWIDPALDLAIHGKTRSDMPEPGHHDGWGMAAYVRKDFPEYLERQPHSVTQDVEHFKKAAVAVQHSKASVAMVHFRKISVGEPKISNTHPFLYQEWSFCHNGTIFDSDHIPLKSLKPGGGTDSERFFLYLMEHLDPEDPQASIRKSIGEIKKGFKFTSLTFLLSDGKTIYAYRDLDPQFQDYYTLYTANVDGSRIVCSEPLTEITPRWEALPNETLLAINC